MPFIYKVMLSPFLILLRIDAGGTLEITAEIGCGGETELIGGLLDGLLRMRIHDKLRLCRYLLLNPFQGRESFAELAEYF